MHVVFRRSDIFIHRFNEERGTNKSALDRLYLCWSQECLKLCRQLRRVGQRTKILKLRVETWLAEATCFDSVVKDLLQFLCMVGGHLGGEDMRNGSRRQAWGFLPPV